MHMSRRRVAGLLLTAAALGSLTFTTQAHAETRVKLTARFEPDVLGQSTTILYKFRISNPLPVKSIVLHLPTGMELLTSSLGLSECTANIFIERRCPPNSIVGHGTAWAEVLLSFQPHPLQESATVTAALGPPENENPTILFFIEALSPVYSILVLPSQLTLGTPTTGASLTTQVPELDAWTEGPPVALTRFQATIGPRGITYYRHEHGHRVAFHPRGLALPTRCPQRGFRFSASFHFYNGTTAIGRTIVPCPTTRARTTSPQT